MIIGCDFDGTICHSKWPAIGKFRFMSKPVLKWLKRRGHILVLWTCRGGPYLDDAVYVLRKNDIEFDHLNENVPGRIAIYGDCRKLGCDLLIDDRACYVFWPYVMLKVWWLERRESR